MSVGISTRLFPKPTPRSIISIPKASAKQNHDQLPMVEKKKKKKPRLISISTDARWHGELNYEYTFSMQDLQLNDLSEYDDVHKDTNIFVSLCVQKHSGLGMTVEGRIVTCYSRKCCNCYSPYLREIDTTFDVWILPSARRLKNSSNPLPEIGGDDPSVIYVKPGDTAELDSVIQDTIRLAASVKEKCSESCQKSEPKLLDLGERNTTTIQKRWHKLLELKNKHT